MGANFEQLLRAFFSCFRGQFFSNFFENPIASAVKESHNEIIKNEKNWSFIDFFWNKTGFVLGLRKFSNLSVLQKGLLLQDWVLRLGKFLLDPKINFLSLDKWIYKLVLFLKIYESIWKNEMAPPGFEPGPIRLGATYSTNWAMGIFC